MKSRITITISRDILGKIDLLIDKKSIRNRSHAIEYLIIKTLKPYISKAIILAGGSRNGSLIAPTRKIAGISLIETTIDLLIKSGVKIIVIRGGKNLSKIKSILSGKFRQVSLIYVDEKRPLGTASAIKESQQYINQESFLVIHGDILTNINLLDFIKFHEQEQTLSTIAVKPRIAEKKYGKVLLQGNKISRYIGEKEKKGISIVNAGIYCFKPEIFDVISSNNYTSLEESVFPEIAKVGELSAFLFQGIWCDISSLKDYKLALDRLK